MLNIIVVPGESGGKSAKNLSCQLTPCYKSNPINADRHMTVATTTLKMTTPSAVDTEVICYIITKDKWKRTKCTASEYEVAFMTFSSLPLPFTAELLTNWGRQGNYLLKASVPGVQLDSGVSS